MNGFCENCGREAELTDGLCATCRGEVGTPRHASVGAAGMVAGLAGLEPIQGFSGHDLLSEAFRRHTAVEKERFWAQGAPGNIPALNLVDTAWPRPWMFVRCLLGTVVLYALFYVGFQFFGNANFLPGLILTGAFAAPLTLLVFFFEMNARRNVSLAIIARAFLTGGALALVVTMPLALLFAKLMPGAVVTWLGASSAGIVEELAKLAAVIVIAGSLRRLPYTLNGLLLGAAVGAGFAAFESAGYVLRALLLQVMDTTLSNDETLAQILGSSEVSFDLVFNGLVHELCQHSSAFMFQLLWTRLVCTIFGSHILYTGMAAAALWMVKGKEDFRPGMLFAPKFLRIFLIAVVSHALWNSPLNDQFFWLKYAIGAVDWIVIFALIGNGLKQLREEQTRCQSASLTPESPEVAVQEAIREDAAYAVAIAAEPVPTVALPDPLGICEEVQKSARREHEREEPHYEGRSWQKYYKRER